VLPSRLYTREAIRGPNAKGPERQAFTTKRRGGAEPVQLREEIRLLAAGSKGTRGKRPRRSARHPAQPRETSRAGAASSSRRCSQRVYPRPWPRLVRSANIAVGPRGARGASQGRTRPRASFPQSRRFRRRRHPLRASLPIASSRYCTPPLGRLVAGSERLPGASTGLRSELGQTSAADIRPLRLVRERPLGTDTVSSRSSRDLRKS
jgi:hypothetical protein